jgi:uncharacterized OB-fold protein
MHGDFPLPDVTWEPTQPFWTAAARGELHITRCDACGRYVWYPEPPCRACGGHRFTWTKVSGRGRLFSWSVIRHAFLPQFAGQLPLITALVTLAEDPDVRLVTTLCDITTEELRCDMPLRVVFRPLRFAGIEREVMAPLFTRGDQDV